ncbi:MAG: hypothetical protein M3R02_11930 [Chloroflexota bacterium]|nr:hypothetical protein [Chloroflexota bacterium]
MSVPPYGLGYDPKVIDRIVEERKTAQARAAEPKKLLGHGGDRTAGQVDSVNLPHTDGGTSADYLTARIARDHPAILERMRAGGSSRACHWTG